jgi:DnaA-homolog protein
MQKQLTFTFPNQDETTFERFYPGSNEIAFQLMQNFVNQTRIFCAYLWGAPGSGKTHLLQAACTAQNKKNNESAAYLSLRDLNHLSSSVLQALQHYALVCIDDVNLICQKSNWEEALFHFYNQLEANQGHLIFSSNQTPKNLLIQLPDLKSRIGASFILELKPLSDPEKLHVLKEKANNRGFSLPENVLTFLINHFPRDMGKLVNILDALDSASLTEKRQITIPFIKTIL